MAFFVMRFWVLLALIFSLPVRAVAEPAQPGNPVPITIEAPDQNGTMQNLETLSGENGLILLFSRSLDWCSFCRAQALEWNSHAGHVRQLGYQIAVLTYDPVSDLGRFAEKNDIAYTLLSDPDSQIIKAFGIMNQKYNPGSRFYGIPHPTIFVINPEGEITQRFDSEDYKNRPDVMKVLSKLEK